MTLRRGHQGKVDATQRAIVEALRQIGCSVQSLGSVGCGCPDLLVGRRGRNHVLEVKQPGKGLRQEQIDWHREWRGEVWVVTTPEEAIAVVQQAVKVSA